MTQSVTAYIEEILPIQSLLRRNIRIRQVHLKQAVASDLIHNSLRSHFLKVWYVNDSNLRVL